MASETLGWRIVQGLIGGIISAIVVGLMLIAVAMIFFAFISISSYFGGNRQFAQNVLEIMFPYLKASFVMVVIIVAFVGGFAYGFFQNE